MTTLIENALAQNRAEELGYDVWPHFVMPLFFDKLDLSRAKKPRIVMGGRGCGKTMLLRYLSHQSAFSRARASIPAEQLSHIGVYWRADTQFANTMTGGNVPDSTWRSAFQHSLAINVGSEILKSLISIATSSVNAFTEERVRNLDFSALRAFDSEIPSRFDELLAWLRGRDWGLQSWMNNPQTANPCVFLPTQPFLKGLIEIIQAQLLVLKSACICVYIDEYENLLKDQQRLINTLLKHSEPPLVFNLAMKRNGMKTKETVGEECITDIADYRTHDLDFLLSETQFSVYAAEILFIRLAFAKSGYDAEIDIESLKDPAALAKRRGSEYQAAILRKAEGIFPGLSQSQLASYVFEDSALVGALRRSIERRLKQLGFTSDADKFLPSEFKEAAIIVPALLHRKAAQPEAILLELGKLARGESNKFTGKTNWIHNNFYGCLLQLYAPYDRPCPIYAGFDSYISLASGNLRHFLELCHKGLRRIDTVASPDALSIPIDEQAEAAKQASTAFMTEVRGFGRLGNRLHAFILTLGSIFAIAHRRATQSEPEITHFGINRGTASLSEDDLDFFREALKWSVLNYTPATKLKDPLEPADNDWILNPIYAPYFHISFRKKRKLAISSDDIAVAIRGNPEQRRELLRRFSVTFGDGVGLEEPSLFSGGEMHAA
jgi:hypothetical protein